MTMIWNIWRRGVAIEAAQEYALSNPALQRGANGRDLRSVDCMRQAGLHLQAIIDARPGLADPAEFAATVYAELKDLVGRAHAIERKWGLEIGPLFGGDAPPAA